MQTAGRLGCLSLLLLAACQAAEPPPYWELLVVRGTPYERGLQHGEAFTSKIHSLYTQLLTNSLIPSMNRDRPDIAAILLRYQDRRYDGGEFARRLLLESAESLLPFIPPAYVEEMHGIADGAGMPFEDILILNTFVDTVLSVRTVQHFLWRHHAPKLTRVRVEGGLEQDGLDNDGDGTADEADEATLEPYDPSDHALLVGLPEAVQLELLLEDPDGVDPATVRVQVGERLYAAGDPAVGVVELDATRLQVTVSPAPLPEASIVVVQVQAGDRSLVTDPPPAHARFMRDQFLAFATVGLDARPVDLPNRARDDDRFPPPALAFAARGTATAGGQVVVGHHFALLDAGVAHKHAAALVHVPDQGRAHVTFGLTGVIWGTSGMNDAGLTWAANMSDTLDNPQLEEFRAFAIAAQLKASDTMLGILGREVLTWAETTPEAVAHLRTMPPSLGWNFLLADRARELAILELDANGDAQPHGGALTITPGDLDGAGRPLASVGPDDLRVAGHYQLNRDDIDTEVFGMQVPPQRRWSGFWHRSLRAFGLLGDALADRYGRLDADEAVALLRLPALVDRRDSMNAAVFLPEQGVVRFALGRVPATDAPFVTLDLAAAVDGGGTP